MMEITNEQVEYISGMVARARAAMKEIEDLTQEDVRRIAKAVACLSYERAEVWSNTLFEENGGSGRLESKVAQLVSRPLGLAAQVDGVKTVGVIEEDPDGYLVKIAKPLGVVASLMPMTVPTGLVACQTIFGLMSKNAMIFSPHPRTKKVTNFVVNDLRELLGRMGYPRDLLQCIEKPSLALTDVLMKQADFVIATGGAAMVKSAYSSGHAGLRRGRGQLLLLCGRFRRSGRHRQGHHAGGDERLGLRLLYGKLCGHPRKSVRSDDRRTEEGGRLSLQR